jgi:hypothetical protein
LPVPRAGKIALVSSALGCDRDARLRRGSGDLALLVVPGYSFLTGYRLGRSHTRPDRDLYAIAEAVVVSAVILAIGWFRVEDLLGWIDDDTVSDHAGGALVLLLVLIVVPFVAARVLAALTTWIGSQDQAEPLLRFFGVLQGNAWQNAWKGPLDEGALVVVELNSGETVYGQAVKGLKIDFPPLAPAVYLPHAYRMVGTQTVKMEKGIYISGDQISAAYFADDPDAPKTS